MYHPAIALVRVDPLYSLEFEFEFKFSCLTVNCGRNDVMN